MTDIHVPDEVVESTAKELFIEDKLDEGMDRAKASRMWASIRAAKGGGKWIDRASTAIRAALAAWVECGMAKGGVAWKASIRDQHSWLADTDLPNPRGATFPVLIIKTTEAP